MREQTTTASEFMRPDPVEPLGLPRAIGLAIDGQEPTVYRNRGHIPGFQGALTWWGTREDYGEDLIVTQTASGTITTVTRDGESWQITEAGGRTTAVQLDMDTSQDLHDTLLAEESPQDEPLPANSRSSASSSDPVIDVLVVFNKDAGGEFATDYGGFELAEAVPHHIDGLNVALQASGVGARFRLVGVEVVEWPNGTDDGVNLGTLRIDGDGIADVVHTLRDALGADIVIGITEKKSDNCGLAYTNAGANHAFAIVDTNCLYQSTAHEVGHLLGLRHWADGATASCSTTGSPFQGRYGFQWPDPLLVTDPNTICTDEPFHTKMGGGDVTIDGVPFDAGPRLHRFSNAHRTITRACTDGSAPRNVPTGNETPHPTSNCHRDSAARLVAAAPAFATYRPTVVPDPARIWWPGNGSYLTNSTTTFYWTADSPTGNYQLEVYRPDGIGGTQTATTSSTQATISGLSTSAVLAVRLWSEQAPGLWHWHDHRFNTDRRVVSCDEEDIQILPFHDGNLNSNPTTLASCSDGGNVCAYDTVSDTFECQLNRPGSGGGATGRAFSNFGTGFTYDIAAYGTTDTGADFCCLFHDPSGDVDRVKIVGTSFADDLRLHDDDGYFQLEPYGGNSLTGHLSGYSGDDLLSGSSSNESDYSDYLRGGYDDDTLLGNGGDDEMWGDPGDDQLDGGPGEDLMYGNDGLDYLDGYTGDDHLKGGRDRDYLHGGAGTDVLISLESTGFGDRDWLYGEQDSDLLCSNRREDALIGSDSTTSGWNFLYYTQAAAGTQTIYTEANGFASNCGHTAHGTSWGNCSTYSLTSAPAACSDFGVPD